MWIWEFSEIKKYFLLLLTMFTETKQFFLQTKLTRKDAEDLVCVVMYLTMLPLILTVIMIPLLLLVPLIAWVSRTLFELVFGIISSMVGLRVKDAQTLWALSYAPYVFAILAVTQPIASIASLVAFVYLLVERYKATGGQVLLFIVLAMVLGLVIASLFVVPFILVYGMAWVMAFI